MPTMDLTVELDFSSAHFLPRYDGPCARMHGHNYKLHVHVRGAPDPVSGLVVDFADVERIVWEHALSKWDHRLINDFLENPTAENMVVWLWEALKGPLPQLSALQLWETPRYSVVYKGEDHAPPAR